MNSGHFTRSGSLRLACGVLAASTATVLLTSTSAQAASTGDFTGDGSDNPRVLQSVDVELGADGTLTTIDGTVIESSSEDVDDAETSDQSYAPDEVAGKLPLRVMTSWRTDKGAGTDLADLAGYDGKIRLDLTVQNLTVRPQMLTYDYEGESRERAALVGAPLTVVAAADLGDIPADQVITAGTLPTDDVTNGVLGKGTDDETQVQWATILAPPQLGSSARFSLVVDAQDFQVPDLDISVQPGLVTDPSLGALVDSAFDPQSSTELALQRDTISTIGDVNTVLARASATIGDVRKNLSSSAETLGQQTVTDLQGSMESVTGSMETVGSALTSLDSQITGTLKGTESAALSELQNAVQTVDQMLGDTSRGAGSAAVRGNGCSYQVSNPGKGSSLYDSMLSVAGLLNGYSKANQRCRDQLTSTLLTTIGPENPEENCTTENSGSVSCTLEASQEKFEEVAQKFKGFADRLVNELLNPDNYSDAVIYAGQVASVTGERVYNPETGKWEAEEGTILYVADMLRNGRLNLANKTKEAKESLEATVVPALDAIIASSDLITPAAATAIERVDSALGVQGRARLEACAADDGGTEPGPADRASALLTGLDCADSALDVPESPAPDAPATTPASTLLGEARSELDTIQAQAALVSGRVTQARQATINVIRLLRETIDVIERDDPDDASVTLSELQEQLETASQNLATSSGSLSTEVEELKKNFEQFKKDLDDNVTQATNEAIRGLEETVGATGKRVGKAGARARKDINKSFAASSTKMGDLAAQLVARGRTSINEQKREFKFTQQSAAERVGEQIRAGLGEINAGVSSSVRDLDAAGGLLTADLRKVLLDLGQRKVDGGGLLGAMTTSASTARSADYQLALANEQTSSFTNVRGRDIDGLLLRQEQGKAAMEMLAALPAFELDLGSGTMHRTVYNYRLGDGL